MGLRSVGVALAAVLGILGTASPAAAAGPASRTAPYVARLWPQQTDIGTEPTLIIDFSVPMAPDVSARLEPATAVWWYWDKADQLVVMPQTPLRPATPYRLTVSGRSSDGTPLRGQTVYSFITASTPTFAQGPHVLTYHINGRPRPGEIADNFVSWEAFEFQLDALEALGYEFGTLDSGCRGRTVCLTFDDGWATQFAAAQMLAARGIPATFFVTVGMIDRPAFMSRAQVRALAGLGMRVESHLMEHDCLTARMHELPPILRRGYLQMQLARSQQVLRAMTGQPVRYLAYPYGCYDWTVIQAARRYYDAAWTTERTMPLASGMSRLAHRRLTVLEATRFTVPPE